MSDALLESHGPALFKGEYEQELERWFRTRFKVLCALFAGVELITTGIFVTSWQMIRAVRAEMAAGVERPYGLSAEKAQELVSQFPGLSLPAAIASSVVTLAILAWYAFVRSGRVETRLGTVREASWMIILLGAVHLSLETSTAVVSNVSIFSPLSAIFFWHFLACLVLPWTPRESLKPMVPLVLAYAAVDVVLHPPARDVQISPEGMSALGRWALVAGIRTVALPLVLLPGVVICWWRLRRHARRFGRRMASQGFIELRRELAQARRIHESLFPPPAKREDVEFDLHYRPMREVGGDFAQAWTDPLDRFMLVVIDVTGHGLAAAMTVNRLAGELDRIRAENPLLSPAAVLIGLNRYIHLTLARHNIFATAVAAQLDPNAGRLVVANAGHPAAILRRRDGRLETRDSSAYILGAVPPAEFEVSEQRSLVDAGDILMLVTDGMVEARDRRGRAFGESRLREACGRQPAPERWARFLADLVETWSGGVAHDDLLVATLALSPRARTAARRPPAEERQQREETETMLEPVAASSAGGGAA